MLNLVVAIVACVLVVAPAVDKPVSDQKVSDVAQVIPDARGEISYLYEGVIVVGDMSVSDFRAVRQMAFHEKARDEVVEWMWAQGDRVLVRACRVCTRTDIGWYGTLLMFEWEEEGWVLLQRRRQDGALLYQLPGQ